MKNKSKILYNRTNKTNKKSNTNGFVYLIKEIRSKRKKTCDILENIIKLEIVTNSKNLI